MKTPSKSKTEANPAVPAVPALTVGIDLGDKKHALCALDDSAVCAALV